MAFSIYLSPPDVGPLESEYVLDALESGWIAPLGPHVEAFENEVAEFVGRRHAVALSSGTAALHLALIGVGVRSGDEVVVPTMTFAASAFPVRYIGARPIFVDVEPQSWNIDPHLLRCLFEERKRDGRLPSAVVVVDVFGQAADYGALVPLCEEFGVPLIEDAAEALGATCGNQMAGAFGRTSVLSFNGNKIMTTSGGGMLLTDDEGLADRSRYLSTQARQPVAWYEHEEIGFNYRLSNVLAALGRAQLSRLGEMIEARRGHRARYAAGLSDLGVVTVVDAPWGRGNCWLTVALFDDPSMPVIIREALAAQGIEARPVWKPMHSQPVFMTSESRLNGVADDFFARGLCLPSGSRMTPTEGARVCEVVAGVLAARN